VLAPHCVSAGPVIIASDIRMPDTLNTDSSVLSVELPSPYSQVVEGAHELLHRLAKRAWFNLVTQSPDRVRHAQRAVGDLLADRANQQVAHLRC
jgi:hypothetical protein